MTLPHALPHSSSSLAVKRIGRFYLTRELGRGTVGCVYLGHDPVIDRDIAIKTFNPRLTPAERSRYENQFINEARAAGRLTHPHIVTIYDASSEGGTAYIAMEYLQGRELHKMLDSGHRFTPDETASIAWKIADALHHAHRNEVVHRDIKPANIFMVKDDQPKLIDFGIARSPNRTAERAANSEEPYTMFQPNNLLGTPNYMSPEQALGKAVDARTDIYSLGAVMYEMLVGRKPFHADSASKLLQQIAYKAPPAPHEIEAKIPLVLSHIVMRAMSKRPEKRYQDAEQMALDIKRYLLKQRRAHQSMQVALAPMMQQETRKLSAGQRKVRWGTYLAVTAGAIIAAIKLVR
ncbi:MAG TPA: serine/threonine-protein kinase [Noviherbaspirillum sp.]|nr:serine/threonine-protein kinase [Noviherbaspirillum sp.]